ncbi:IS3 family transposase [Mesoplasma melaleucae]|uniref:Transposase n=1 Tax=Mesoplasma melaleucae TaxID=81459 RepID=A0A2K8NUZ6_9MOLU|nr:IS3 family transposase [Mesoplasma melaleucae]ATZ17660.1 transposase [Mesoplasma melaleucae]
MAKDTKLKRVEFISNEIDSNNLSIKIMLDILQLKRSYWDKYKNKWKEIKGKKNFEFNVVNLIYNESLKQFGYRRVKNGLKFKLDINYSNHKIRRIMKENHLIPQYHLKAIKSANLRKGIINSQCIYEDKIKRQYKLVNEPYKVFYTDVTYLISKDGKRYMSTIIDGYSKKVIDYKISDKNDQELVMNNIKSFIKKMRKDAIDLNGIILHSDRGVQYQNIQYQNLANKNNIVISMGRTGVCYDNVVIESFHSLLKKGTIYNNKTIINSIGEYQTQVKKWVNWYNQNRDFEMQNNIAKRRQNKHYKSKALLKPKYSKLQNKIIY